MPILSNSNWWRNGISYLYNHHWLFKFKNYPQKGVIKWGNILWDSLQVTNAIHAGDLSNFTDVGIYFQEIFLCVMLLIPYVRRSGNTLAHALCTCLLLLRLLLKVFLFRSIQFGLLIDKSVICLKKKWDNILIYPLLGCKNTS